MNIRGIALIASVFALALWGTACTSGGSGDEAGQASVQTVRQLRLATEQIGNEAIRAVNGDPAAYKGLHRSGKRFTRLVENLKAYEIGRAAAPGMREIQALAARSEELVGSILHNRAAVEKWHGANQALADMTNELLQAADELALNTVDSNVPREQVYIATRQLMLLERLRAQSLEARFVVGEDVVKAVDRLGRDATLLTKVSEGFLQGDATLRLTRLEDETLRNHGRELSAKMKRLASVVSKVMDSAPDAFRARQAQVALDLQLEQMRTALARLQGQLEETGTGVELAANAPE